VQEWESTFGVLRKEQKQAIVGERENKKITGGLCGFVQHQARPSYNLSWELITRVFHFRKPTQTSPENARRHSEKKKKKKQC
jgi:hypothetical protein